MKALTNAKESIAKKKRQMKENTINKKESTSLAVLMLALKKCHSSPHSRICAMLFRFTKMILIK